MNNSFCLHQQRIRIQSRNEGKLKSFGSCSDVRAWCHDVGVRDRYLREWMKSNMPICSIPVTTWATLLRIMTCRRRGKATPLCHPDCKSKVILDSICVTCEAMRNTFKGDENFEKYFDQEELDTSHWPNEKCLDALKSIKMLWKIIFEKVFQVNVSKNVKNEKADCAKGDNINDIAKMWTQEIIQHNEFVTDTIHNTKKIKSLRLYRDDETRTLPHLQSLSRVESLSDLTSSRTSYSKIPRRKISRYTSVKRKMVDVACEVADTEQAEELKAYKTNLYQVQEQYNAQYAEINKLKSENTSLKLELKNIYNTFPWKSPFRGQNAFDLSMNQIPKPFEAFDDEIVKMNKTSDVDSEMIITLKNCQNESLKNIEILQVLHKTNIQTFHQKTESKSAFKKEDPVQLLKKVQNTFGAIFKREICIASEGRRNLKAVDINATFQRVGSCKSAPSCSTFSAYSSCST